MACAVRGRDGCGDGESESESESADCMGQLGRRIGRQLWEGRRVDGSKVLLERLPVEVTAKGQSRLGGAWSMLRVFQSLDLPRSQQWG